MITIFISYRRGMSSGWAGRLAEKLRAHFGSSNVFMDIETLQPGADFVEAISSAVKSCDVLLAIIAPDWINAKTPPGGRRLDDPGDFVRIEVTSALSRNVTVIPVLVGDATMPTAEDLPDDLKDLARRQAHELSDTRWDFDCQRLIDALDRISGAEDRASAKPAVKSEGDRATAGSKKNTPRLALTLASVVAIMAILIGGYWVWREGSGLQVPSEAGLPGDRVETAPLPGTAPPPSASRAVQAEAWERAGFDAISARHLEDAIQAFASAREVWPDYHMVAEIADYLRTKAPEASLDAADWTAIDREILEKYSWKMPEDLRDGFRARVTASK